MTPEEKSKELYFKFIKIFHHQEGILAGMNIGTSAKASALICCYEIISTYVSEFNSDKIYWQQVRNEIEKL